MPRVGPEREQAGPEVVAGRRPVVELLRAGRPARRVLIARGLRPSGVVAEVRRRAGEAGVPVTVVPQAELDAAAPGLNHQGVVAVAARFRYTPLVELLGSGEPSLLFLDGVTDPQNLGSLIRSAEVAGFTGMVLPARRAAQVTPAVRRVSAGAAEVLPIARVSNLSNAIEEAKRARMWVLGLDACATDVLWDSDLATPPVGVVLGSEGRGLSRGVASHCDGLVSIPVAGRIGSLNVSVAGAVAMFEIARRRRGSDTL